MTFGITKLRLNQIHSKLLSQLSRNERVFQESLRKWFDVTLKQIRGDITTKFQKDITSELTDWKYIEEQGKGILRPATLSIMQTGGNQAYKLFEVKGAFDVLNVDAVKAADKFCAKLVTQVTNETKAGIRIFISTGIKEGKSMDKIARDIRPLIGLTERQTQSIMNYRELLSDKEKFPGLTISDIDRKVDRYSGKTHRRRAEMISRTETARAQNIGYAEGLDDIGVEEVEFSIHPDEITCPICSALDGKKYKVEDAADVIPVHPNCFISGRTFIYTSKGWKAIKNIRVNDLVLTHKGRFRKVISIIRTPKQQPDVTAIYLKNAKRNYTTLTATDEHPILLDGKWQKISAAKVGMVISYLASSCRRCNNPIPFYKTYCSDTCCSLDTTDRQWASDEHRKLISIKTSKQLKKQYASGIRDGKKITAAANKATRRMVKEGKHPFTRPDVRGKIRLVTNTPEHRAASSERMKICNPMNNPPVRSKATESLKQTLLLHPEKRLNARMANLRKSGQMTWIENRMKLLLDKLKIDYVFQYPILNYDVDFAIPALRIVIECDGEYWHLDKYKDLERQHKIEKEGWFVLRYTGLKINQYLDEIENEVKRIVANHRKQYSFLDIKIVKVKKWKSRKPRTLYNFSVEDDESYIAKGFVVHNCRCALLPVLAGKTAHNSSELTENIPEHIEELTDKISGAKGDKQIEYEVSLNRLIKS